MIAGTNRKAFIKASFALTLALATCGLLGAPAWAEGKAAPPEAVCRRMLEATKSKSYEDFVAEGDDNLRAALTRQMFDGVSGMVGPKLRKGYQISYLGQLRQDGADVFLWRLDFTGEKDQALVKMAMKDGKVAGIFLM